MEWSAHLFSELCKISHVTCGHWFTILFVSQFCFEVFMQVSVLQWISTSPSWYTSMNVCMYVYMNPHVHMHVHSVLCVLIPKMSASVSDSTLKQQCCRGALGAANCQEGPRLQRREVWRAMYKKQWGAKMGGSVTSLCVPPPHEVSCLQWSGSSRATVLPQSIHHWCRASSVFSHHDTD